jgi:hypothetical protein
MKLGASGVVTAEEVPSAEEVAKLIEGAPTAFGGASWIPPATDRTTKGPG